MYVWSPLPRSLAELSRYDFFILSDVPAERVGAESMDAIERYVRDLGGGFMLAGGAQGFGLGGYQDTRYIPVLMSGAATALWNGFKRVDAA